MGNYREKFSFFGFFLTSFDEKDGEHEEKCLRPRIKKKRGHSLKFPVFAQFNQQVFGGGAGFLRRSQKNLHAPRCASVSDRAPNQRFLGDVWECGGTDGWERVAKSRLY